MNTLYKQVSIMLPIFLFFHIFIPNSHRESFQQFLQFNKSIWVIEAKLLIFILVFLEKKKDDPSKTSLAFKFIDLFLPGQIEFKSFTSFQCISE